MCNSESYLDVLFWMSRSVFCNESSLRKSVIIYLFLQNVFVFFVEIIQFQDFVLKRYRVVMWSQRHNSYYVNKGE